MKLVLTDNTRKIAPPRNKHQKIILNDTDFKTVRKTSKDLE